MRTILVHLNIEVPDDDPRTPNEVADAILDNLDTLRVGSGVRISAPLGEEV